MLARQADSLLSLMGKTEKIFQQPNQPPTVGLLGEFVGHQARRTYSQDEEGVLTVFLVNDRRIEDWELGLCPQGDQAFCRWLERTGGLWRRHHGKSWLRGSGGEVLHLSNGGVQSSSGTSLLGQLVAARLLYRDACAPRQRQSSSTWRRDNSILSTREHWGGRHRVASKH